MNVRQVIELAKEWVDIHGSQTPGFCGAHLMGSINYTPRNAPFPSYKDVDLNIVLKSPLSEENLDIPYQGLILECGRSSNERYHSPEMVLSDPGLAANLAVNSILSDPTGMLFELHTTVAKEYPRRKWVIARCETEKEQVQRELEKMNQSRSPIEAVSSMLLSIVGLAGIIAVADLKPPTHRRCLILMKALLEKNDRTQLHEDLLKLLGFAHLEISQVMAYLQEAAEAFDRAVQVTRTPVPFSFKLHAYVRPYLIEGAQEMIDEGYPREAMPWIAFCLLISNGAIQADAPEDEKLHFQAEVSHLLTEMGWGMMESVPSHFQQAKNMANDVFKVADDIVRYHPEIVD